MLNLKSLIQKGKFQLADAINLHLNAHNGINPHNLITEDGIREVLMEIGGEDYAIQSSLILLYDVIEHTEIFDKRFNINLQVSDYKTVEETKTSAILKTITDFRKIRTVVDMIGLDVFASFRNMDSQAGLDYFQAKIKDEDKKEKATDNLERLDQDQDQDQDQSK